uniref:Uncharacterized protein n=1 Tax=Anguilla anguilla TaxID=7936 RepID=A0A0E9XFP1_ANGAN
MHPHTPSHKHVTSSLAHDQPFHKILCKSVNPFGSHAPFCDRPRPSPRPLLVNRP